MEVKGGGRHIEFKTSDASETLSVGMEIKGGGADAGLGVLALDGTVYEHKAQFMPGQDPWAQSGTASPQQARQRALREEYQELSALVTSHQKEIRDIFARIFSPVEQREQHELREMVARFEKLGVQV